jgi:hypothetical protein
MNPHGLAVERDLLVEMAQEAAGQDAPDAAEWKELAATVAAGDPDEPRLESLARAVRTLLLRRGHRIDEEFQRSPDLSLPRTLPGGERLQHSYERNLPSVAIEAKLASRCPALPEGWQRRTLAFSSGMAGLTQVVQTLGYLLGPTAEQPVRLHFWGDYFETDIMLEYLSGPGFTHRKLDRSTTPAGGAEAVDVLLVEPVRYNWTLDALDVPGMVANWRRGPRRAPVIVLDTTLSSPLWPTPAVLAALASPAGAPLVIEVRSGLKLDQQGMEIANLGVVDIFRYERSLNPKLTVDLVAGSLALARSTAGVCLPAAAVAALDVPFLLDERWTRRHAGSLFQHNARLADRLSSATGGLFASVAHPSLDGVAHGPFVVISLREDEDCLENHGLLLAVIRHEAVRRGLVAVYGSSFGFRTSRFETIIPRVSDGHGLFKVSAGSRGGPSLNGLTDLLVELAAYPSMVALRAAYDLAPVRLG